MNNPIHDLNYILKQYKNHPRTPVAVVFREGLRGAMSRHFQSTTKINSPFQAFYGIDIYYDSEQAEDCLAFYDVELLNKYLNRHEDPKSWGLALAEIATKLGNDHIYWK